MSVADLPPDRKAIHNERAKYMATWLNSAGASAVTVGVIAPLAALTFGYPNSPVPLDGLLLGMGLFLLAGAVLHLLARIVLGRLNDRTRMAGLCRSPADARRHGPRHGLADRLAGCSEQPHARRVKRHRAARVGEVCRTFKGCGDDLRRVPGLRRHPLTVLAVGWGLALWASREPRRDTPAE